MGVTGRRPGWSGIGLVALLCVGCPTGAGDDDADDTAADDDTAGEDDDTAGDDDGGDDDTAGDDDTGPLQECGDGVIEPPEVCDDHNTDPGDGCSADCMEKRILHDLGISGTVYDLGRDAAGQRYVLWKDGPLQLGEIVGGQVTGAQAIPDSSQVNKRYTRPRLAVRPDGAAFHTSWFQGVPGEECLHAWRDPSGVWTREVAWSNGGQENYIAVPAVGVDLTGTVQLIAQNWWYTGPDGEQDESTIIRLRKPPAGPWSAAEVIHAEADKNWRDTSLFTDLDGGLHATWKSQGRPGKYRHADSGGDLVDAATVDIAVPPGEATTSFGDTFVDGAGNVHHAFFSYPGQGLWYAVRPAGDGEFDAPVLIATADNDEHQGYENPWPGIAVDADGRVFVVWAENRGAATVPFVVLAQCAGGSWSTEDLVTDAAIDLDGKPAITAVGKDVSILWRAGDGTLQLAEVAVSGP